ncbi:putative F0F1-ATPase subunit [Leptospira broomii serovar Hurstbridge str. 5399]|uniref:F0F1-ATPase subunit n=1 Tax=Leptospira broomii serovar Hurstbridge str. 5399 TaxID=1049789 RepID=T0FDP6_9LEPT|nr:AtpZ/AtpI family protein [Leptospira broomii]EQA45986.1 putative F0F1-ATPase subunit [Leptospira broomii serovar Hurstbridge str. 5399]
MPEPESKKPKEASPWELAGLGMEFCFIVVGSIFIGNYLDSKFGFSPFGILGGSVIGFTYGIYYILYRVAKHERGEK